MLMTTTMTMIIMLMMTGKLRSEDQSAQAWRPRRNRRGAL